MAGQPWLGDLCTKGWRGQSREQRGEGREEETGRNEGGAKRNERDVKRNDEKMRRNEVEMRRHDDEMRRHEVEMRRREEDDLVEGGRRSSNVSSQSSSSPISPSMMEHDHSLGETFSLSGGKKSFSGGWQAGWGEEAELKCELPL